MTNEPKLSVVIPWCNRDEVCRTLLHNCNAFQETCAEVVIVNCGGDVQRLRRALAHAEIGTLRLIDLPRPRFNKSLAINIGVYASRSPRLFVLDTDICLHNNLIVEAVSHLEGQSFVTVRKVYESEPKSGWGGDIRDTFIRSITNSNIIQLSFVDGTSIDIRSREDAFDGSRSGNGLIFANTEHLIAIGGYNSELEGWGWEDDDIQLRLRKVLGLAHIEVGEVLHLSHGDEVRALFGASRRSSDAANFGLACRRYSRSDFCGTYLIDVSAWKERMKEVLV
jgi:hypothetical protein